jgi:uncharacterized coiled-coil DUF342 family protein
MANKIDGKPVEGDATQSPASGKTKILDAPASTGARSDSLVAAIESNAQIAGAHAEAIEQNRTLAEKGKGEIDGLLTVARDQLQQMRQQLDSANATGSELANIRTSAQMAEKQTAEAAVQASTTLESIHAALAAATATSGELGSLRTATEKQTAEAASQASATLESIRATLTAATATSNELASLRTAAEKQTAETSAQALAALESIRGSVGSATEAASRAEALRTQVEQTASVVATKSDHIEGGRVHADEVRAKIDGLFTQAQQSATNAEAQHQAGRTAIENVNAIYAAAQTSKANIDSLAEAITTSRDQCDKHMIATKRLAETADGLDASIKKSQAQLAQLEHEAADRLKTIDDLLLGATNAGLATAFEKRGRGFKRPEMMWQLVFVGSLVALFGMAIWETAGGLAKVPDYSELARMLLQRLPFVVPIIWLAIHSARQAALAKRMEEEYAFKATISTSFEGYRRQMAEISKDLSETSPLARLCNDTLRTIGAPPGKVYEKHRMDPTPGTAAAEFVAPVVEGVTKALAPKLPKND